MYVSECRLVAKLKQTVCNAAAGSADRRGADPARMQRGRLVHSKLLCSDTAWRVESHVYKDRSSVWLFFLLSWNFLCIFKTLPKHTSPYFSCAASAAGYHSMHAHMLWIHSKLPSQTKEKNLTQAHLLEVLLPRLACRLPLDARVGVERVRRGIRAA